LVRVRGMKVTGKGTKASDLTEGAILRQSKKERKKTRRETGESSEKLGDGWATHKWGRGIKSHNWSKTSKKTKEGGKKDGGGEKEPGG